MSRVLCSINIIYQSYAFELNKNAKVKFKLDDEIWDYPILTVKHSFSVVGDIMSFLLLMKIFAKVKTR